MKIAPFAVEEWMNANENDARFNIAETCVDSISLDELFAITGTDRQAFFDALAARRLTYGAITGDETFKAGVCRLYKTVHPGEVIPTHGAAGANHHLFYSLLEPGDHVISVMPTYQQLYDIPRSFGAEVSILRLREENGYLPDTDELRALVTPKTKLICLNNPNNPTGALMDEALLREMVEIAREKGAWLLCDEVYRHLTQQDGWSPSIVDLYEKGISIGSMSKVFSIAGLRLGWIAAHDEGLLRDCLSHRDYDLISCGVLDEQVAALALAHQEKLLARSRAIVRENLALLDAWVASEPRIHYVKPKAGTTALLHYDAPMDSYDFCARLLRETGAFVTPGDCFGEKKALRIGYACGKKTLEEGLAAMSAFLRGLV